MSAILANGHLDPSLRSCILVHERIIAVDRGLLYCQMLELTPHLLVGDWDSCPPETLKQFSHVEKIGLHPNKDETDLEIAILEEIKRGAKSITLFGAWGKRIDHSLTNALLLGRYPHLIKMQTETEILFAIDQTSTIACQKGQTLSLIPLFGPAKGIVSSGLKWELKKQSLDHHFIGVSNICLKEEVSISIEEGLLLCALLKEGYREPLDPATP